MRKDMAKVIVERPRERASDAPPRNDRRVPLDDLPTHESMRRRFRKLERKELNENLKPLLRYLFRQVGRPWDKVYSEICRFLKPTSTVQQHVRDHIGDFVATHPCRGKSEDPRPSVDGMWRQPLYVHPRDGLLKRTVDLPERKRRRFIRRSAGQSPRRERIPIGNNRELRRINGIWYELTFAPLPEPEYEQVSVRKRNVRGKWLADVNFAHEVTITKQRLISPRVFDIVEKRFITVGP